MMCVWIICMRLKKNKTKNKNKNKDKNKKTKKEKHHVTFTSISEAFEITEEDRH